MNQSTYAAPVHSLKVWPQFWNALESGAKTFEARRDDRGFTVGDILMLQEWCPGTGAYTGRQMLMVITYKLSGPGWGVEEGFCVLGIAPVRQVAPDKARVTDDQVECAAAAACSFHTNQKWSEVTNEWKQFYRANARAGLEALAMVSAGSEDKNREHA